MLLGPECCAVRAWRLLLVAAPLNRWPVLDACCQGYDELPVVKKVNFRKVNVGDARHPTCQAGPLRGCEATGHAAADALHRPRCARCSPGRWSESLPGRVGT